uniref:Carbamoyl phosphate synthase small chain n=1 Tax=Polysiphonia urceolata TaxID=173545 RepID=A0A1Z1MBH0_POLUR|nr:carbamoyl phosphate synthase small subunit [Polysiphonia stricta]ARW63438.1 carbamoyl phosphate synthase small subunit [Polysiphonia stricta]
MSYSLYSAVLYLQDGNYYKGWSFFELPSCFGELVFNTGMTGYQEILSDPSYAGQMVLFTHPEIGNTGLNKEDNESNFVHIKALITKNISAVASSWRSEISLRDYLILKKIPHIFGIDTRSVVKRLTLNGVMNAKLFTVDAESFISNSSSQSLEMVELARKVTSKNIYNLSYQASHFFSTFSFPTLHYLNKGSKYKIVVIDFGLKFNILRNLLLLGCDLHIIPVTASYDSIKLYNPDGILLSNGPGNPLLASYAVQLVKKLVNFANIPILGICMGHQILNLALGSQTFKLKFGHRGLNHPSGSNHYSEITSQNHGYAVEKSSLLNQTFLQLLSIVYFNLNDSTISVTCHKKLPIFSVQYHPEASPGPRDSEYLFQAFINLIDQV